jgi:flagellar assembly factor FliW
MTSRFGELEIEEDKVIEMPDGIVGFKEDRFLLLHPDKGPFCWFQAVANPDLAFVVVDPTQFVPDYQVKLTQDEYDKLKLVAGDEIILLSVVTMARDPRQVTMNLQGPIVINPSGMIAKQIVLETVQAATRHPLFATPGPVADKAAQTVTRSTPLSMVSSFMYEVGLALSCG